MTKGGEAILRALKPNDGMSGAELVAATGISSGSLYPALVRLEQDGKIRSAWVDEAKPRRRLYYLSTTRSRGEQTARKEG